MHPKGVYLQYNVVLHPNNSIWSFLLITLLFDIFLKSGKKEVENKKYVLGIDGGGTKTTALLAGLDGSIIAEAHSGPSNIQTVGEVAVAKLIVKIIQEVCEKGSCNISEIRTAVFGLAGAGREVDRNAFMDEFFNQAVENNLEIPQIIIETDARIALEAAFASSYGIVLISGTGSVALAKSEDGNIYRLGGWGKILGDEGSGYCIGRKALNLAIRSLEGRIEKTVLSKLAFEHYGISSLDDLIIKIYREKADIASFVPKVLIAAQEHDHISHNLLFSQANELADLVRTLITKLKPKRMMPIALIGGLLENENLYSKMVKERIVRSLPQTTVQKPKFPTAFGAVIMGLKAFEFK